MPEIELFVRIALPVVGFIVGFYTRILTDRFKLRTEAGADLIALVNREIFVLKSGKRPDGVTNADAVGVLVQAADRYRGLLITRRARRTFDQKYTRYKDQIDNKNLHQESDPYLTTFGYNNFLNAAQRLREMMDEI